MFGIDVSMGMLRQGVAYAAEERICNMHFTRARVEAHCKPGVFLHVRVLSLLFRRLFLEQLQFAFDSGRLQFFSSLENIRDRRAFVRYLEPLKKTKWVVYAKRPFAGPEQVLDYVGRYTHRVAISNSRLLAIEAGHVSFGYKDYRNQGQQKAMTLSAEEFIRRFLLHRLAT
jgi:hypothetical protein